ncbi:hypothetical protein EYF80_000140 [Liparis tanakae]|uniref:Uncharacterized protein n=1 Tax=Liparis tanakae TaxID=230148 RepID=A0A4Z2JHU5_9TELE|nr:hypothetical protein EYF80_000140 [Liparis tanakae]
MEWVTGGNGDEKAGLGFMNKCKHSAVQLLRPVIYFFPVGAGMGPESKMIPWWKVVDTPPEEPSGEGKQQERGSEKRGGRDPPQRELPEEGLRHKGDKGDEGS